MDKMQMMLVDHEERFLSTTGKILRKRGYDVETAAGGQEALEKLRTMDIHVVLLDVKIPEMDGIEVLKRIKRRYPLVEVIMLSGYETMESVVDGLKAGATDYLMKPADLDELIEKSEQAFARRQALERKIHLARTQMLMKAPMEILRRIR